MVIMILVIFTMTGDNEGNKVDTCSRRRRYSILKLKATSSS